MISKKKEKELQRKNRKLQKRNKEASDRMLAGASFIEKYGVQLMTIAVATVVCGYIVTKIPEAFAAWNDGSMEGMNPMYIYGTYGCTVLIWIGYVLAAVYRMIKNSRK